MSRTCAVFIPILTSLKDWENTGILSRELIPYTEHHRKYHTKFLIFSCGGDDDKKYEGQFEGIEVVPLNITSWTAFFFKAIFLPFKYRQLLMSVDLIKIDQMWSAWLGLWFALSLRKKLWSRMGYEHYQLQCSQNTHIAKRVIVFLLSLMTYKRSSFITVTTANIKEFIEKKFRIPGDKIHVRANYIDTILFKRTSSAIYQDRLLYIGRLDVVKNLESILRACKEANVQIDIVGKGPMKESLERLAHELNLKCHFLGVIPNEKLAQLMEQYKYYILASFHEGNPKSLLEAMSMECTCIATDVPGIRQIVKDGKTGFLCQTDSTSIARVIQKVRSQETVTVEKKARSYILQNNSLDQLIEFENDLLTSIEQKKK